MLVLLRGPTWSGTSACQMFRTPAVQQAAGKKNGAYPPFRHEAREILSGRISTQSHGRSLT